jgi:uncharacterized protein YbjT (DUF2867 family)
MKIVVIGGTGLIGSKTISKSLFSMALIDTRMAAPLLYAGGRADVAVGLRTSRTLHLCPDGFHTVLLIVGAPDFVLTSRRVGKDMG